MGALAAWLDDAFLAEVAKKRGEPLATSPAENAHVANGTPADEARPEAAQAQHEVMLASAQVLPLAVGPAGAGLAEHVAAPVPHVAPKLQHGQQLLAALLASADA